MKDGASQISDVNHDDHTLSLDHLLENIDSAPSQKSGNGIGSCSSSDFSTSLHKDSYSYIDGLFRGDEEETRDVVEHQESTRDLTRDDSTVDDMTGGHEEFSEVENSFTESFGGTSNVTSFMTPDESYSISVCTEETTKDDYDQMEAESFDSEKCDKISRLLKQSSRLSLGVHDYYPSTGSTKSSKSVVQFESSSATDVLFPSVDSSSDDASYTQSQASKSHASSLTKTIDNNKKFVEPNISVILAAVSSNISSVLDETVKWSSTSKATHANDILVEVEAFTVESRHLMNRPGVRCPASLPIPIFTVGVNCIGRVVDSSAHSALHGITFRDRVAAIYPFEYEKKRIWSKEGGGCAYVDAGFAVKIPKHIDAADASTLLHVYTPVYQSIQAGIAHSGMPNTNDKYSLSQLEGQSILIQNGHTEVGLALIEMALRLGAEYVFAPASCIHHSKLVRAGATPLGLVPNAKGSVWKMWKMLQETKSITLVIIQKMPSISMLDLFESVLHEMGSIVLTCPEKAVEVNTSSVRNDDIGYSYDQQLLDVIEKARAKHEKATLERRLASSPRLVKYHGVMSTIADNPLVWKEDVAFLVNLLARGKLKPRVHECIYSRQDVPNAQKNNEMYGAGKSIVCLPLKKGSSKKLRTSSREGDSHNISLKTQKESFAVTAIAKVWRAFACKRTYMCAIHAARRVDELIIQRRDASATVIQTKWRTYTAKKSFDNSISDIIRLQYLSKKWLACCQLKLLRKEKYMKDFGASTKIAAAWRKKLYQKKYSRFVQIITAVQSFVRRKLAIKSTHFIKAKKHEEFARLIEVEWQARVTVRRRNKVLFQMSAKAYSAESSAVVLQARWRAHFTRKYFCAIHHYATAIQLFVRRCFARGKNNQNIRAAITCQSAIRMHLAIQKFTIMKRDVKDIIICQYSVRRYFAAKNVKALRNKKIAEQQANVILLQSLARTKIAREKFLTTSRAAFVCQRAIRSKRAVQKVEKMRIEKVKTTFYKIRACSIVLRIIKYRSSVAVIQMATRCMFARRELANKKAQVLYDLAESWRQQAALVNEMNRTHNVSKCRHSAARTIQAAYKSTKNQNQVRFGASASVENFEDVTDLFESRHERPSEAKGLQEPELWVKSDSSDELVVNAEYNNPNKDMDQAVCSPSSVMSGLEKSMQETFDDCMNETLHVTSAETDLKEGDKEKIATNSCYLDSEHCFIDDDGILPSQFSPSSYMSEMATLIQNVFSDCVAKTVPSAEEVRGEVREIIELRPKWDSRMEKEMSNSRDRTDDTANEVMHQTSSNFPVDYASSVEDTETAEFVSAVVVIQTYLHEINENKNVNAALTHMDLFEYENFYKDMLYGVDDHRVALKQIVKCQSVARRMIAFKKTQRMRGACNIVLRHTKGGTRS